MIVSTPAPDRPDEQQASTLATLWRLRQWARPHRRAIAAMIVCATGAMLAQSAIPLVLGAVVDGPIRRHDNSGLLELAGLALGLGILESVLFWARRQSMAGAALGIETDIRRDMFSHLQRLPVAFHDRWPSGQLLSRMTTDLSTIRRFIGFAAVFLIANTITAVAVVVLLIHLQFWLGLYVAVALIPLAVFTRRFEARYSRDSRRAQDLAGDLATTVEESALGIRVIKSYGRRRYMLGRFTEDARRQRKAELTKVHTLGWFWAALEGHPQLVLAGATIGGVLATANGSMSIGDLVAFLALYLRLVWPIVSLGWLLALAEESASAARRIYEVLDSPRTIVDRATASTESGPASLEFDAVDFAYPDGTGVLHELSLRIEPGETVALVGATGSGKTTVTALVPRLYDVSGGAVRVGGVDVRDLALDELRSTVASAFEEATLFSASVLENLTLGRPGVGDEDVREAIEVASAGFVHELPDGLDTRIGEQGMSLSGGQRQRLALARAVLARPRVLVLDDPLSALDVHTEAEVERALRRVLATTTALVVAHRPSTVLLADRVAVLADGRILAVGTHRQLLADEPVYRQLLAQTSELSPDELPSDQLPSDELQGSR